MVCSGHPKHQQHLQKLTEASQGLAGSERTPPSHTSSLQHCKMLRLILPSCGPFSGQPRATDQRSFTATFLKIDPQDLDHLSAEWLPPLPVSTSGNLEDPGNICYLNLRALILLYPGPETGSLSRSHDFSRPPVFLH